MGHNFFFFTTFTMKRNVSFSQLCESPLFCAMSGGSPSDSEDFDVVRWGKRPCLESPRVRESLAVNDFIGDQFADHVYGSVAPYVHGSHDELCGGSYDRDGSWRDFEPTATGNGEVVSIESTGPPVSIRTALDFVDLTSAPTMVVTQPEVIDLTCDTDDEEEEMECHLKVERGLTEPRQSSPVPDVVLSTGVGLPQGAITEDVRNISSDALARVNELRSMVLNVRGLTDGGSGHLADRQDVTGWMREMIAEHDAREIPVTERKQFSACVVFATYPQNPSTPQQVYDRIQERWGNTIQFLVVSRENHTAGEIGRVGVHLHVLACFQKGKSHTRCVWNAFGGGFGVHLLACGKGDKHKARVCKYVCKDGNYVVSNQDQCARYLELAKKLIARAAKVKPFEIVAKLVRDGKTLLEIDDEVPSFVLKNQRIVAEYIHLQTRRALMNKTVDNFKRESLFTMPPAYPYDYLVPLFAWFKRNFWARPWPSVSKRPHREKNFWLCAPKEFGKSLLARKLTEMLPVFMFPYENWSDSYTDAVELIIFDEVTPGRIVDVPRFLQWTSGDVMDLPQRNRPPFRKQYNPPCIVFSNYHPVNCFQNLRMESLEALTSRFTILNVPENCEKFAGILAV